MCSGGDFLVLLGMDLRAASARAWGTHREEALVVPPPGDFSSSGERWSHGAELRTKAEGQLGKASGDSHR